MPHENRLTPVVLLKAMTSLASEGRAFVSSTELVEATRSSLPAVKRMLSRLVEEKHIEATGKARAARYRLPVAGVSHATVEKATTQWRVEETPGRVGPAWRAESLALRQRLALPLAARSPVTYRREFVDEYKIGRAHV